MPSCLTHCVFAKELVNDSTFKNVFYLGSQGPDVFFFYGYGKRRKNVQKIREFGTYLHQIDISSSYQWLYKYANNYGGVNKNMLIAYINGLLCHYILDRNTHPYIFFRSGFALKDDEKEKYKILHALYESRIDSIVAKENKLFTKPKKMLKINKKQALTISRMFYCLANNYLKYEGIEEFSFYKSYKDMIRVTSFLFSKSGVKNSLFKVIFNRSLIYAMSAPKKVKDEIVSDYLNKQKREWINPVSGEKSDLSFNEMVQNAYKEYNYLMDILPTIINEEANNKLKKFVNEINHDGFKLNSKKQYFNLTWWKL